MREIAVISGKGGTGKTSIAASLAVLAEKAIVVDCDVDAADLHLLLEPRVITTNDFYSGFTAMIRQEDCSRCGLCARLCRFNAVVEKVTGGDCLPQYHIDKIACEGCGLCVRLCPAKAIDFPQSLCGKWMVSETRVGKMVHARLGIAAENSGKLVSTIRQEAKKIAQQEGVPLIIIDGPPGIGCPVIASVTGATEVLIVTEPTVAGEHDLERVLLLTRHFAIPASVCVNRWDIAVAITERIEAKARQLGAKVAGRVRHDLGITTAQLQKATVVETASASANDIIQLWENIQHGA
ncbi:MAG: ATP-binding protein [Deltaproteobacteria bacterium]|nr:ATP-binding protein [Deltaproteobacteria bacterium]